jgi:4-amino-4-deoxy-L-arabinose transferase-like glycosyltransferase
VTAGSHAQDLRPRGWILTVALTVALALSLRFYTLGDWSFSGDEVATLQETRALFDGETPPQEAQIERLPRMIPVGYVITRAGYALFGADEFGSRVVPAIAGVVLVGLLALLGELVLGRRMAILAAVLIALSPAFIQQSQTNRFYSLAALFAGAAMLAGALSLKRPGAWWPFIALGAATLSVLTHTVTAALVPALALGTFVSRHTTRVVPRAAMAAWTIGTVAVAAWLVMYVRPILAGWNQGVTWAYSPVHAMMAAVNMLGWPVSLVAGLGVVLMVEDRWELRWYWLSCLAAWAATVIALPLAMTYQPWYAFPTALSVLVCAAYAVDHVYDRIRQSRPFASAAFLGVVVLLGLPSLLSHYVDGSRPDARTAIEYVDRHWAPGDRVATRLRTFGYYAPSRQPVVTLTPGGAAVATLAQLTSTEGRLWVVFENNRGGLPADVEQWLSANASHRLHVTRQRYDYFEYSVDVFLVTPGRARN